MYQRIGEILAIRAREAKSMPTEPSEQSPELDSWQFAFFQFYVLGPSLVLHLALTLIETSFESETAFYFHHFCVDIPNTAFLRAGFASFTRGPRGQGV